MILFTGNPKIPIDIDSYLKLSIHERINHRYKHLDANSFGDKIYEPLNCKTMKGNKLISWRVGDIIEYGTINGVKTGIVVEFEFTYVSKLNILYISTIMDNGNSVPPFLVTNVIKK